MKYQMDRKIRLACLAACTILLAATLFMLLKSLAWPGVVEQTVPQFSYNQNARVDYRVYFKSNKLYPESSLGPGSMYVTNFVDYINTSFKYTFSADRVAEVKGEYEIVAVVEAVAGKDSKKVWQREFVLLPKKAFNGKEQTITIQEELPLRLPDYNAFASTVIRDSELIPDEVSMTVRWNVAVEAAADGGQVKEQLAPTLVVPLVRKAFEIGGEPVKEKPGAITAVKTVPVRVSWKKVAPYGTVACISALVLVLLLWLTGGRAGHIDPLEARVRQIVKKHGFRMAAIDGDISALIGNAVPARSVDDLALIADELNKPLVYRPLSETNEVPSFYVFDEPKVFVYEMKRDNDVT
ncbi:DUF5305 family protein [Pelotomaculum sp. PtaB.Bin117]|uniref:DUF5305 family protein n=1 Tax=Pelotomaculum sp. PtaB.Bin117 TaxID=1811694 RepID=UPI0009CE45D3|nr:DUF5305 family protein [Pelotomaculum sp. PtaB.Bin117]OPX89157.1 MAG: hypothetical protein A4E54_01073 [Pelotomaculum sp. PtaB.Bin117]